MSNYAVRGGHNFQAIGAVSIINEVCEAIQVKNAVIKYLKLAGQNTLDVTPGKCDVNTDLAYGVNKAVQWGADWLISIHFNNAYKQYAGKLGTETLVYSKGGSAEPLAEDITNSLANLGFKNRGVIARPELYELRKTVPTKTTSIIVEVCFVEATEDVALYRFLGPDKIGKTIAEALVGHPINVPTPVSNTPIKEVKKVPYLVVFGKLKDKPLAEILSYKIGCPLMDANIRYDYAPVGRIIAVGGQGELPWSSYIKPEDILTGSNWDETLELVKSFKL